MSLVQRQRVAVIAAAAAAALIPASLIGSEAPPAAPPPPVIVTAMKLPQVPELAMARTAPIFSPDRSVAPPPAPPAAPEVAPPALPAPVLVGTVAGPGGKAVVLLRTSGGETVTAATGDLVDEWRVGRITGEGATLERMGERKQTRLDFSNRGAGAGAPVPPAAPHSTSTPPGGAQGDPAAPQRPFQDKSS